MNDNTTRLLEQLANKLGTTAYYLWRVLMRQASIAATTQLLVTIGVLIASLLLFLLHRKFSKPLPGKTQYNRYDDVEVLAAVMVVFAIVIGFSLAMCILRIPEIVTGYINPEYWALNEVLSSLKK